MIAAVLAPVTGAGVLLAFTYVRFGTAAPQGVYAVYFGHLVRSFIILGALPAALFAAMGLLTLTRLRARGLPPRALLLVGAVLGAGSGLLVPVIIASFGGRLPPWPWGLAAALTGAIWGLLVAQCASTAAGARRSP